MGWCRFNKHLSWLQQLIGCCRSHLFLNLENWEREIQAILQQSSSCGEGLAINLPQHLSSFSYPSRSFNQSLGCPHPEVPSRTIRPLPQYSGYSNGFFLVCWSNTTENVFSKRPKKIAEHGRRRSSSSSCQSSCTVHLCPLRLLSGKQFLLFFDPIVPLAHPLDFALDFYQFDNRSLFVRSAVPFCYNSPSRTFYWLH